MSFPSFNLDGRLRLNTPRGIPYELMAGFPSYRFSAEGSAATAQYQVDAINVRKFVEELFPPPGYVGTKLTIWQPPALAGSTTMLFPVNCRVDPFDSSKPFDPFYADHDTIGKSTFANPLTAGEWDASYGQYALITVDYESSMPFDSKNPATSLEHTVSVGGEFLSISEASTRWRRTDELDSFFTDGTFFYTDTEDNKDFKVPVTKIIPTIEHQLRWRNVIDPPWERIRAAIGRVNSVPVKFLNQKLGNPGAPGDLNKNRMAQPETIMFLGVTAQQRFRSTAFVSNPALNPYINNDEFTQKFGEFSLHPWTLDFKFTERILTMPSEKPFIAGVIEDPKIVDISWNYFYRPETGRFEVLLRKDGSKIYDAADFNDIFERDVDVASPDTLATYNSKVGDFVKGTQADLKYSPVEITV